VDEPETKIEPLVPSDAWPPSGAVVPVPLPHAATRKIAARAMALRRLGEANVTGVPPLDGHAAHARIVPVVMTGLPSDAPVNAPFVRR